MAEFWPPVVAPVGTKFEGVPLCALSSNDLRHLKVQARRNIALIYEVDLEFQRRGVCGKRLRPARVASRKAVGRRPGVVATAVLRLRWAATKPLPAID